MTPLHLAAYNGCTGVLDKLMLAGADAQAPVVLPPSALSTAGGVSAVEAAGGGGSDGGGLSLAAGALRMLPSGRLQWTGTPAAAAAVVAAAAAASGSNGSSMQCCPDVANNSSSSGGGGHGLTSGGIPAPNKPPLWPSPEVNRGYLLRSICACLQRAFSLVLTAYACAPASLVCRARAQSIMSLALFTPKHTQHNQRPSS